MEPQLDFTSFQQGVGRFAAAMKGTPDRVPVFAQMHEFAMKESGAAAREFYTTPELLVTGTLNAMEKYGIDVPVLDYDVYNIEAEALGQKIIYSDRDMPDVDRTRPLIREPSDLEKIRTPDFDQDGRFAKVIKMNRLFADLIGNGEITCQFCAPFSLAANLRGIESLLMDIYADPGFARELMDRVTQQVLVPWLSRLQDEFPAATGFCGSDASGSLPIVSPEIIRDWLIPYVKRLRERCGPAVYVPNWVGESYLPQPEKMLDLKQQVCPGFVEGQDPDVESLGPQLYKNYAQKKDLPLILGVGAAFLALSKPAEVTRRVKHYIEVGGQNGRFALYLCNLGATTPPENIRAAVEAVHKFGTYH